MAIVLLALMLVVAGDCTAQTVAQPAPHKPYVTPPERCPNDGQPRTLKACAYLHDLGLDELEQPPGGKIYRETWQGPLAGPMNSGTIVLTIYPDGRRTLETPWRHGTYRLQPGELPDFDASIARSDFAKTPVYVQAVELCVDGVATTLETVVDGHYHFSYFDFCGGVPSDSVADALDQLFVFAAGLSGLHYPVNPDHPTFRGY